MNNYISTFQAIGEVADILLLREPKLKLLVDISPDLPGHEDTAFRKYPNRTSYSICDKYMIDKFLAEVAIGKVIEVKGIFSQTSYIPHKTSYIDTVFLIEHFRIVKAKPQDLRGDVWGKSDGNYGQLH
jgi:hypothetical protein